MGPIEASALAIGNVFRHHPLVVDVLRRPKEEFSMELTGLELDFLQARKGCLG
jgi:hypothetical protein